MIEDKATDVTAYVVGDELKEIRLKLGDMTDAEREYCLERMSSSTTIVDKYVDKNEKTLKRGRGFSRKSPSPFQR